MPCSCRRPTPRQDRSVGARRVVELVELGEVSLGPVANGRVEILVGQQLRVDGARMFRPTGLLVRVTETVLEACLGRGALVGVDLEARLEVRDRLGEAIALEVAVSENELEATPPTQRCVVAPEGLQHRWGLVDDLVVATRPVGPQHGLDGPTCLGLDLSGYVVRSTAPRAGPGGEKHPGDTEQSRNDDRDRNSHHEHRRTRTELRKVAGPAGLWGCFRRARGASESMAIEVETKDCTALSDAELAEMADICAETRSSYEAGLLSKQAEAWVLVTLSREGRGLKGFSFCTLERIGGTPSVLIGLASVKRTSRRDGVLRAMMTDQYRRAVLAFPDEDVLVGCRMVDAGGFEAFKALEEIVPRPEHKVTGEERAWGRRLAKRFGIENGGYNDRDFIAAGDGSFPLAFDHESLKPEKFDADVVTFFDGLDHSRGDSLITFGWAMAEQLAKLG